MISISYINEFKEYDEVFELIESTNSEIDTLLQEHEMIKNRYDLKVMMNESVNDDVLTEGALKIVEGIGRAVESVIKKVKELIELAVDKFNEFIWNKKGDAQKLEKILKAHPHLADDIKFAVKEGDVEIKDIKSMQDLMDGSYDILDKINKGTLNPTEAESKFDKAVNKYQKYGKPVIEILGAVTTTIVAVKAISSLYPDLLKNKLDAKKTKSTLDQLAAQTKVNASGNGGQGNPNSLKSRIFNKVCSLVTTNIRNNNSLAGRMGTFITSTLNKLDKTPAEKLDKAKSKNAMLNSILNSGNEQSSARINAANTAHNIAAKNANDEALAKKAGSIKAIDAENQKAYRTAYHQKQGQLDAEDHNRGSKELDKELLGYRKGRDK